MFPVWFRGWGVYISNIITLSMEFIDVIHYLDVSLQNRFSVQLSLQLVCHCRNILEFLIHVEHYRLISLFGDGAG